MHEYNSNYKCSGPPRDLHYGSKFWGFMTKGLSEAEVADLEVSRATLQKYEKIYSLVEYCSELNDVITVLEKRIQTNNTNMP